MGNLPQPRTRFIGREDEIALARQLLARNRLVTLTGAGGTGKTRLALAVATALADNYADDAWFVSCAAISDPALVLPTVVQSLGLQVADSQPPLAILAAHLAERHSLLVLDNLEQVIDVAPQIAGLLDACPRLTVLVTSRIPLHLDGEQLLPVPPLDLIDDSAPSLEEIEQAGAVALFVQRCQMVKPDFRLTSDTAPIVLEICRRLDGLPLAIELAAARVRLLSPQALLARLEQRLPLLAGGSRDLPARQQTIRDTIAWSYNLLQDEEQRLYRRLAIFAGGWALEAAEACIPDMNVLDGLATLVDHSLVRQSSQLDGTTRFTMLETIREYGLEQLEQHGETANVQERHARFILDLVARAEPELRGPELPRWVSVLENERDNVRAALGWTIEHDAEAAMLAASALWFFWNMRTHPTESRRWIEAALAVGDRAPTIARAKALDVAGAAASRRGEFATARTYFEESLSIFRLLGDQWNVANTLRGMCRLALASGDFVWGEGLGTESVAIFQALGDRRNLMIAIGNLGWNALGHGDLERAHTRFNQSLAHAQETGNWYYIAHFSGGLAYVALDQGDHEQATQLLVKTLAFYRTMPDLGYISMCFDGLGRAAAHQGRPERAARLMGAAHAVRKQIGQPAVEAFLNRQLDRDLATVRAMLSEIGFTNAWDEGRRMSLDDATELAFAVEASTAPGATAQASNAAGLSPRELDVLRLIVEGKSDREIASDLFISHHTVMRHVSNILGKLGVESRTAAATYAVRHNL